MNSIRLFLEYLYIGDGHQAKTSNMLTTTSKQLSDDVCELILKSGNTFMALIYIALSVVLGICAVWFAEWIIQK